MYTCMYIKDTETEYLGFHITVFANVFSVDVQLLFADVLLRTATLGGFVN